MFTGPNIVPCGDRTVLVYLGNGMNPDLNDRVHNTAAAILSQKHPAITEVSPAYDSLLVEYDPVRITWESLNRLIHEAATRSHDARPERVVEIPVLYGGEMGPDVEEVAAHAGLSADEVMSRHAGTDYRVYCLGFTPGFLYLGGLDPALNVPRKAVPRTKVPVGSVAIGGSQTGVYPQETPGGWQLIGRTPVPLFDPERKPPAVASPGESIRFVPIDSSEYERLVAEQPGRQIVPLAAQPGRSGLRVLSPGLSTTVQDLGRRGYQAYGVSRAGAADYWPLLVGNWILGNRARTGALELTVLGPEIEFTGPAAFCLTGAPLPATLIPAGGGSPRPVPMWQAVLAGPGDRLQTGAISAGCRAYLCVAGGFDLPVTLGSVSEDLLAGIGPIRRALKAGDWLPVGLPLVPPADLAGRRLPDDAVPDYPSEVTLRVTLGPQADAFTGEGIATFLGQAYTVSPQSNRQGIRLDGPRISHVAAADILSEGMPAGAIQVPASGQPILALANRATTGGYTKIAVTVFPDVARAAQVRPGGRLRFAEVSLKEAHAIAWAERRKLAQIRRYLDREAVAQQEIPSPPAIAPLPPAVAAAPGQPPAVPGVRRMVVRFGGMEFAVEVEEVTDR